MGATGLLSAETNITLKTLRRYIDLYESGDFEVRGEGDSLDAAPSRDSPVRRRAAPVTDTRN